MVDRGDRGGGIDGTATAYPLSDNGHRVRLVGHAPGWGDHQALQGRGLSPQAEEAQLPEGVQPYYVEEIGEALAGVQVIVSGVNSLGAHWIGEGLAPHIRPGQAVIGITKGLEAGADGNLVILPDVLRASCLRACATRWVTPPWAGHASPGAGGPAAKLRGLWARARGRRGDAAGVFRTGYYTFWTTTSWWAEFCAALKNAYTAGGGPLRRDTGEPRRG